MNIAIFASGSGTNAENIINYFEDNQSIIVKLIVSNNINALVLKKADNQNITKFSFSKEDLLSNNILINKLISENIDFIVLAGFLLKIPENLINQFPDKIINIHPALLPAYGGKGMYGDNVHKAVIENNESHSGISIHIVNKNYDEGRIIFQAKCIVEKSDDHKSLASKIHELEYEYFPKIIEKIITKNM